MENRQDMQDENINCGETDNSTAGTKMPIIGVTAIQDNSAKATRIKNLYTNKIEEMGGIPLIIPNPSPQVARKLQEELQINRSVYGSDSAHSAERDDLTSQSGSPFTDSFVSGSKVPGEFARQYLGNIVEKIDGLLLTGGDDPDPAHFGEESLPGQGGIEPERDILEINLIALAVEREIPVLGICRGMQSLNVTLGGSNYQDIACQYHGHMALEERIKHKQEAPRAYPTHEITVAEGTRVGEIIGYPHIRVNSFHHQAVKAPGDKLVATAWSRDGIIEAVEMIAGLFCVGVQWHPEGHDDLPGGDELFRAFVNESAGAGSAGARDGYFRDFNTAHSCGCCSQ